MKKSLWKRNTMVALLASLFILTACSVTQVSLAQEKSATYTVDPVHSSLVFRVKHLGITYIYGRFNNLVGTLTIDDAKLFNSSLAMSVKTADVDTGNTKRDDHLRSPDFFNAKQFPTISFRGATLKKLSRDLYEVEGELDLHGVKRPLKVKLRQTGSGRHPSGDYRIGFESRFTINRSDFDMTYMLGGVSDEVLLIVTIQGIRQ